MTPNAAIEIVRKAGNWSYSRAEWVEAVRITTELADEAHERRKAIHEAKCTNQMDLATALDLAQECKENLTELGSPYWNALTIVIREAREALELWEAGISATQESEKPVPEYYDVIEPTQENSKTVTEAQEPEKKRPTLEEVVCEFVRIHADNDKD